ncbi:MAG: type II toxin-antitoxin system Phd/YefM family antitoxin [Candidatus Marinimicrobia bacterium]|nr:type II toxin-antitoxin system Phd/YefM family antitoxin [Candidatus Neomarinimicrobiota bacterium]MCH7763681.1 type II toxin-antitoxin system Phd/YefM family antitoxin [Candidatus Neomarinimicrobiota bacterium]
MTKISILEARKNLADVINSAQYGKERIILTRHGKEVAGIISIDDLNLLEELEDRLDLQEAIEILENDHSEFVDWDDVKDTI